MGIRGSATYELVFTDCKVPKENLLGELGKGFKIAMMTLDGGRLGIAAQAVGIAADMQAKTDATRLLVYRMSVTERCVQLAKDDGYTRRYLFERFMRDTKITELYEGTSEVQKIVISHYLFDI